MIFIRPRVALTLLAALFVLALPAVASAAVYEVDSTGDQADENPGTGGCKTAVNTCTLRAAIQEANASSAVKDTILFKATEFQGQMVDTIEPATVLPAIISPVEVNAGTCATAAGVNGPCAGVNGPGGQSVLSIEADETAIYDLAITGGSFGIAVGSASTGFIARGDWIGVRLDGTAGGNNNIGIFVDPNSDGATIGGTEAVQRNVIANTAGTGLDLEGASEATIQGNYFGVGPDGETPMANGKDIEITGRAGFTPSEDVEAEDNEVGATVAEPALASDACDGGCNVISGALGAGIDLNGSALQAEKPAAGPTVVHGNFIGLDATGTDVVANGGVDIWVGGADQATAGGSEAGDANYIAGGSEGIVSETGGEGFEALGNVIGFGSDGSEQTPPAGNGIFALNLSVSEDSKIEDNVIRMIGGNGIEVRFLTGRIVNNEVLGGAVGIWTKVGEGEGLIASNVVDASGEYGILIESPDNEARRNTVTNSNGSGIAVQPSLGGTAMNGNLIGGSSAENENVINGSEGPAIEIFEQAGEPGSTTEISRNRGASNGGPFIDLVDGANQGIAPPVISAATQTKAEGTAEAGATVRVFRKATASPGEIESFLAEAVADGSGNWKVTYGSIPGGTNIAATQTDEDGGTSELALTAAAADPSGGNGGGNNGGGNGGGGNGGANDKTPPQTKILKGPPKKTTKTTVKFKFSSSETGSTFQCKLDKGKFKKCRSPKKYKKLKPGKHVFKVRAIDKAGNVDPTPAKRKFTVLK